MRGRLIRGTYTFLTRKFDLTKEVRFYKGGLSKEGTTVQE